MTSDEDRQKKRKRLRRNHLAKALEDRLFRQRKISKDYKKKRVEERSSDVLKELNEIEASYEEILKDDLHSD